MRVHLDQGQVVVKADQNCLLVSNIHAQSGLKGFCNVNRSLVCDLLVPAIQHMMCSSLVHPGLRCRDGAVSKEQALNSATNV